MAGSDLQSFFESVEVQEVGRGFNSVFNLEVLGHVV